MTQKFSIDSKAVRQLAEILSDTNLGEIEYEEKGNRIRVARPASPAPMPMPMQSFAPMPAAPAAPVSAPIAAAPATDAPAPAVSVSDKDHPGVVTSPLVGTAYLSPEPGAAPFVKEGSSVQEGDTLMIVEAMKVMNPIKATKSGTVSKICISDATPVEFGDPLIIVE